jgi:hypothetical protein
MIALIATWLGIPLWIVFGVFGLLIWHRVQFMRQPNTFEAKLRLESGSAEGFKPKWPRLSGYALWVHDVLLVHDGLGLRTNTPVGVVSLEGPVDASGADGVKRLGESPVVYRLTLDNGATLLLAVPQEAQSLAFGPFAEQSAVSRVR